MEMIEQMCSEDAVRVFADVHPIPCRLPPLSQHDRFTLQSLPVDVGGTKITINIAMVTVPRDPRGHSVLCDCVRERLRGGRLLFVGVRCSFPEV